MKSYQQEKQVIERVYQDSNLLALQILAIHEHYLANISSQKFHFGFDQLVRAIAMQVLVEANLLITNASTEKKIEKCLNTITAIVH